MTRSIYDPAGYPPGVPNPYGGRIHAWNEGPAAYGTRYHGSVWTKPMWSPELVQRPIRGIGGLDVDTREGIFANSGYGGGVFNGNVGTGVGALESTPSGLGAAADPGAIVMQKFANVMLESEGYCKIAEDGIVGAKTCGAVRKYGGLNTPEMVAICNEKGYVEPTRPPCPGSTTTAPVGASIAADQISANMWLTANGYCQIDVDGTLGPKTCGAFRAAQMKIPTACTSFVDPSRGPCPGAPAYTYPEVPETCQQGYELVDGVCVLKAAPGPAPEPMVCPEGQTLVNGLCVPAGKKGLSTAWMLVGGIGLAAVVAGALYAAKKKQEGGAA